MFPISVSEVVPTEFFVYVFTILVIDVSSDEENVVFRDAANKGREHIIEGVSVCFISSAGSVVAGNNLSAGDDIERSSHYFGLYFLDAV